MSRLNKSYISSIKDKLYATRFSPYDFDFSEPAKGDSLLIIQFKYNSDYIFHITEETEYDKITQKGVVAIAFGESERTNTKIVNYARYNPGEFKKHEAVSLYNLSSVDRELENWCRNIYRELIEDRNSPDPFDDLHEELENQIKNTIQNENEIASDEELSRLNDKFETLISKFSELEESNKITTEELSKIQNELDLLKGSADKLPKGIWARIAKNKFVDLSVQFIKSKEGRDILITGIKRLVSGSSVHDNFHEAPLHRG